MLLTMEARVLEYSTFGAFGLQPHRTDTFNAVACMWATCAKSLDWPAYA